MTGVHESDSNTSTEGYKYKVIKHITETLKHKNYVIITSLILSKWLLQEGEIEAAIALLKRAAEHDNTKFSDSEIAQILQLPDDPTSFKNPSSTLSPEMRELLKLHWSNNRHHPEFHADVNDMMDLDLMELACDWGARSLEFGTDLLKFATVRQQTRFHFSDDAFAKIYKYCTVIVAG